MVEIEVLKMPQVLSPCNSGRRSNDSNSPEFEFSSFPEQELHSADELFSGGVILPLHHLHHHSTSPYSNPPPPPKEEQTGQQISTNPTRLESESSRQDISADISNSSTSGFTSSMRWKDIFKKTDKKCSNNSNIDGFEQERKVVVVAATNRKQDLDPALISRFDAMINFGLPDDKTRQEIAAQYAKHLTKPELAEFAAATEEMSGRDIRDVCQQAERHWASKIIRGQAQKDEKRGSLPPLQEYIESATTRRQAILSLREQIQYPRPTSRKPLLDFQ
ncbi:protease [Lithospermum erythrorhizon]|uniref:Protease n=1 Tax=Lithospermum erythrorhizon TaxID=34254 RepID=A0AAV3R556_LITER